MVKSLDGGIVPLLLLLLPPQAALTTISASATKAITTPHRRGLPANVTKIDPTQKMQRSATAAGASQVDGLPGRSDGPKICADTTQLREPFLQGIALVPEVMLLKMAEPCAPAASEYRLGLMLPCAPLL